MISSADRPTGNHASGLAPALPRGDGGRGPGAGACREPGGGVVVLARLAVRDLEAVEGVEHGRAGGPRVVGGEAGDVLPHRERLGRALLPYLAGMPRLLP